MNIEIMKILKIIKGERTIGEKLPAEPTLRILHIEQPSFFEWSREFKVSTRSHQNPVYYELKSKANVTV